jgi:methylmalonyl-CoA mutase C-terminal domain/subunit
VARIGKVLLAKTALDGHWRGVLLVAQGLRDAGFEVVMVGMARADEIAAASRDEDVDLVALNVGGHVAVVERILDALHEAGVEAPVIAGGTISPPVARQLEGRGIRCFPPGSSMADIVATATELVAER